ncbi:MAG: immunoglobulin domain-containing protein, partial [Gemmataceae bacterium]|nr:immunoglobulin domain-containing protein [Gemmataceae bacterium]
MAFRTDDAAGYFAGDIRAIPTVAPGSRAFVQVRAWAAAAGPSYDAAVTAGGKFGASTILSVTTGNLGQPPTLPAPLTGLLSFKLQLGVKPQITAQPQPLTLSTGAKAHFEVTATGTAPLAYQWRKGSTPIPNATNRIFEIASVSAGDVGSYLVRVSNTAGFVDSTPAQLNVSAGPVIANILVSAGARVGSPLRLEAVVQGTGPFNYQWRRDGLNLTGATAAIYETSAATAGTYSLRVTNAGGDATRDAVTVAARAFLALVVGEGGQVALSPSPTEVVSPTTNAYPSGTVVTLTATPNAGYQFKGWSGAITGSLNPATVTLAADAAVTAAFEYQGELGTVDFRNFGGGIDAPVTDVDGTTRLQGPAFLAQLYAAPVGGELLAVGGTKPFRTATAAGYIDSSTDSVRGIPNTRPGARVLYQIRVWQASAGTSYEAARAAAGKAGVSAVLTLTAGGGLTPPTQPTGLAAFKLTQETPTAPRIVTAPKSVDIALGAIARFQVTAAGSEPLAYQWRKDGVDLPGKTSAVLEIPNAGEANVGLYTVRVSNPLGSVESTSARLRVPGFLLETYVASGGEIKVSPLKSIYANGTVVTVEAVAAPGYVFVSWGGALSGSVNPTTVTMSADRRVEANFRPTGGTVYLVNRHLPLNIDAPVYDVDGVTKLSGEAFVAQLFAGPSESTLIPVGGLLPFRTDTAAGYFRSEERSLPNVAPGGKAFLQVRAWERSSGETFAQAAANAGKVGSSKTISVTTGGAGSPPTLPAFPVGLESFRLQVGTPLRIVSAPAELTVMTGGSATFRVVAEGTPSPSFQWRKGDQDLANATQATFTLAAVTEEDAGLYSVRVYNTFTEVITTPVALKVLTPPTITRLIIAPPDPAGTSFTLGVVASGTDPLHYEWYEGATGDTSHPVGTDSPTFGGPKPEASTTFWVRVLNEIGRADSEAIPVTGSRRSQTITLAPVPPVVFGMAPTPMLATASSGLPVTFTVLSGPATITGNLLTPTGAGHVRLQATQSGNDGFLPAPAVEVEFTVNKGRATLVLRQLQQTFDGSPKQPEVAVTPAGLRVQLTFNGSPTAPSAVGVYPVEATVDDANYQGSATGQFQIVAHVSLAGVVFNDLNNDGQRGTGEAGLAGATIRLLALDGTTELRTTASDANGAFTFAGLAAGTYYVEERNLAGYASTTPDLRLVSVTTDAVAEVVFGDQLAGSIRGLVFDDTDGDGTRDDAESGLTGVTVRLTGGGISRTTTTSSSGAYEFAQVTPGSYALEEIDPSGYSSTTPNVRNVSLTAGGSATANFGDQAAGAISGVVFNDLNGSGVQDAGENGIAGVDVRLAGEDGQRTRVTDANGAYSFDAVTPGAYTVEEIDPLNYVSTTPN